MAQDKVKALYDTFVREGYNMESEAEFRKNLADSAKRKAAYDALVKDGYDMEAYDAFETNIGYGKSTQGAAAAASAPRQSAAPEAQAGTGRTVASSSASAESAPAAGQGRQRPVPAPAPQRGWREIQAEPVRLSGSPAPEDAEQGTSAEVSGSRDVAGAPEGQRGAERPTWQPSVQDKIRMSYSLDSMLSDFREQSQARLDQAKRAAMRMTPEGRGQLKAAEMQARMAGAPTGMMGLTPDAGPAERASAGEGQGESVTDAAKPVTSAQSPVPYGVRYVNGKPVTEWLLPDGTLTTDFAEADKAEYGARRVRLMNQFVGRMKENGLDPSKQEDVRRQAQIDYEAPVREAVAAALQADDERSAQEREAYMGNPLNMAGGVNAALGHAAARKEAGVGDLSRIAETAYSSLPEAYRRDLVASYTDYFTRHPEDTHGKTVEQAARDAARSVVYGQVHEEYVKRNGPQSRNEFFLRKMLELNPASVALSGTVNPGGQAYAELDAMERYGAEHRVLDIAGTVAGMAMDPATYLGGWVGKGAYSLAMRGVGRMMARRAAWDVAGRYAATTLAGRITGGMAAGGANFGTFEAVKDAERQLYQGGYLNPETGEMEGFSLWSVLNSGVHGLGMGAATGVVSPLIGNVADTWVKATASTAGKVALRGGETVTSKLFEGTIFAAPDVYEIQTMPDGQFDRLYAKRYGYDTIEDETERAESRQEARNDLSGDAWNDSMAMMMGFGASHMIKTAPSVIRSLRPVKPTGDRPLTRKERIHNNKSFAERLRERMDQSPADIAMTDGEREELKRKGYGELSDLFAFDPGHKSRKVNAAQNVEGDHTGTTGLSRAVDYEARPEETGNPTFDGYEAMERLMEDGSVSEATRAKAYYILTGRSLPMSTVTGWSREENGDGTVTVTSRSNHGSIVTSRSFADGTEAQREIDRIRRQAELNTIDIGEQYRNAEARQRVMEAAIEEAAPGADPRTAYGIYEKWKRGDGSLPREYQELAERIEEAMERNTSAGDGVRPEGIRERVSGETGVDIDKAIRKEPGKRTEAEREAVERYVRGLFPEPEAQGPTPEQAEAQGRYEEGRLLYGRYEEAVNGGSGEGAAGNAGEGTADGAAETAAGVTAEVDAIVLRMQEADQLFEEAFGAESEYYRFHLNENPWGLVDDPGLTADRRDAVLYWINAKAALDGVMDASTEAADRKRAEVKRSVARRTHRKTGSIIPATMKVDDREVYIVKGDVVMFPDGTGVDVHDSSESVVVMDARSGEYGFTSPDQIFKVGESIDPEEEMRTALEAIEQEQGAIFGGNGVPDGEPGEAPAGTDSAEGGGIAPGNIPADGNNEGENIPAPANVEEYDRGYEEGIQVGTSLDDEILNSAISDLRSHDWLSDEWRGRLEAYEYIQQERAQSVPETGESVPDATENGVSDGENAPGAGSNVGNGQESAPQTALSRIPLHEGTGEPMFEAVDRDTAWDGLVEAVGSDKDAADIAQAQIEQASTELEALKKKPPTLKAPKLKGSPMAMAKAKQDAQAKYDQEVADHNQQLADTQARLNSWLAILGVHTDRTSELRRQQEEARRQRDAELHDEANRRFEEEMRLKAEKEAEQAAVGTHAVNPKIKEKWDLANKIEGNPDAITLPDGSSIRGKYVLTEAGAATASHDAGNAFEPTAGFPIDKHGQSVNDRDYQRDRDAQQIVRSMADAYDSRAMQTPVIVSKDGIVLSGNNRTMSGDIAAGQGTDGAYLEYLSKYGRKFGFTPEQMDGMKHPRVVFVPDEDLPYDAATFARFNGQEMKSQSKPEAAIKLGKIVDDAVFNRIVGDLSRYDRLSDFYADQEAAARALGELHSAGVINDRQLPELRTGTALSAAGKELIENTLIGKVFQSEPDAVRMIISMPTLRQSVILGLNEIANNRTLAAKGYDLSKELSAAVDLVFRARTSSPDTYREGMPVSSFGRQMGLFDDEYGDSRVTDGVTLLLADILNSGRPGELRRLLAMYDKEASAAASGKIDLFNEEGRPYTKEEILNTVNGIYSNGTARERQTLVDAAVADRRERAAGLQQRGGGAAVEQAADSGERGEGRQGGAGEGELDNARRLAERHSEIASHLGGKYSFSDERANNGEVFYRNSEGRTDLAEIPEEIFDRIGLEAMPFKLTETMAWHVYSNHARELGLKNLDDAIDFVLDIVNNVDHVRLGRDHSYIFSVEEGRRKLGKRSVAIVVNTENGDFMGIRTSGYETIKKLKERPVLWSRGTLAGSEAVATPTVTTIKAQQGDEHVGRTEGQRTGDVKEVYTVPAAGGRTDTDTPEVDGGQNKGVTAPAGDSPQTSGGKDNTLPSDKQGNGGESSYDSGEEKAVVGLEGYTRQEIKDIVGREVERILDDADIDAEIVGMEIHGSRNRGDARGDSDLDIVLEYKGDVREYAMSDAIGESPFEIGGIQVDVNPIRAEETGTLAEYMEKSRAYDAEKKKQTTCPVCGKAHIPNWAESDVVCPQCNTDLSVFRQINQLSEEEAGEVLSNIEKLNEAYKPDGYGDFGPIFTQFRGKAQEAIKVLTSLKSGEAIGALHHKDIGDIDLVWGEEGTAKSDGYGLAKLVKYHPEVIANLQEILDGMHIVKRSENRINLESDTHKAAVRLTWNKEKKKWLLTAFEKKETSESIDKTTDTDDNPKDLRGDTALSQNSDVSGGKVNTLPSDKQVAEAESSNRYTITPATYTNKKGKTSDVWLVKPTGELSKEEKSALDSFTREPLTEGKKTSCGWYDRKEGGYMMRSEEAAKALADMIGNEEAVQDAQPMTANELREAVSPAKDSARPAKGKKQEKAPVNRVSLEDVMTDLTEKGETKLSDHAEPVKSKDPLTEDAIGVLAKWDMKPTHQLADSRLARHYDISYIRAGRILREIEELQKAEARKKPEPQYEISDDEMASLADELRDLLGIGDDEGDSSIRFRDPGELTPQERQKIQSAGIRMAMGMIERGVTKFPDLATRMVAMLGDKIRPWMKSFYEGARWTPGYEKYDFTPSEEVAKFDVENFDKPAYDAIKDAEMRVEERKAQQAAEQAAKELKETRNKQRKENDKQREADTAALAEKADAVAKQAEADAESAGTGRKGILRTIEKVDETIEEINDRLALLGYYEAEEDDAKFHESYGYMLTAEKKAVADATTLARQLVKDLGIDLKVTSATTPLGRKSAKKGTAVRANLAPAGGDVMVNLPLNEGRELVIYIGLDPVAEKGSRRRGDNLAVERIMYRVENPNGSGMERYGERNIYAPAGITYADFLRRIKNDARDYLPKQEAPKTGTAYPDAKDTEAVDKWLEENSEAIWKGVDAIMADARHDENLLNTFRADNSEWVHETVVGEFVDQWLSERLDGMMSEHPATVKAWFDYGQRGLMSDVMAERMGKIVSEEAAKAKAEESHNGYKRGDEVMWDRYGNGKWEKVRIEDFDTDGSPVFEAFKGVMAEKGDWSRVKPADGFFGEARRVATKAQAERKKKEQRKRQPASSRNGQDLTTGSSTDVSAESSAKITISDRKKTKAATDKAVEALTGGKNKGKSRKTEVTLKADEPVGGLFANLFDESETPEANEKRDGDKPGQEVAGGERPHTMGDDETGTDGGVPAAGTEPAGKGGAADEKGAGVERGADGAPYGTDENRGVQPRLGDRGRDEGDADSGSSGAGVERNGPAGAGSVSERGADRGAEGLSEGESATGSGRGSGSAAVRKPKKPKVRYTRNFRYDEKAGNEADSYTPSERLEANVKAIETLAEVLFGDKPATEEQRAVMSRFRGWGQVDLGKYYDIDHILRNTYSNTPVNRLAKVIRKLDPQGEKKLFDAIKRASLSSYYTPTPIARAMNTFLGLAGFKGGALLDPSMGNGMYEGTLPKSIQERTAITGVELDWISGQLSRMLYPDANVMIGGFEKSGIAPGSFDVVTSNVPFGDIVVNDPTWKNDATPLKRSAQNRIHNYYAVKMLEATRPGGLVAMLTTSAVMDTPGNQNIRAHIADQGEILGAIRLPDNTFQGTGVVTDILFIRKWRDDQDRAQTRGDASYMELEQAFLSHYETTAPNKLDGKKEKVRLNGYFEKNPRNLIGEIQAGNQYGKRDAFGLTSKLSEEEIGAEIEKAVKRIVGSRRGSLFNPTRTIRESQQAIREAYKGDGDWVSNGNLVIQDGKVGVLTAKSNEYGETSRTFEGTLKHDKMLPKVKAMIELRTAMKKLIAGQIEGIKEETLTTLRSELQKAYDTFVGKYGRLQDKNNAFILDDIDGYTLQALETWKSGKFVGLSDIFTKNSIKPQIKLEGKKTPQEAVALSLAEYGYLRPDYLAKTLGEDWAEQCGDWVFLKPNSEDDYVTRDEYLSGDVVTKLAEARAAAEKDESFERNVKALEEVQPARIPFDDIAIHLGARWIPENVLNDFVNDIFGIRAIRSSRNGHWDPEKREYVYNQKSGVRYIPETDSFEINIEKKELGGAASDWETPKKSAKEILQAALEDKSMLIKYKDEDGNEHIDEEQTELANQKIADLRERFESWLPSDPERVDMLEQTYNDRFNRTVIRHFDGSHLVVPGLMGKELRPHQKDAVWMLINNRGGIVDHIVGAGKTLVMQSAIMEMRRMGIARKPMIVALKSTVAQIAREFKVSFPSARVLAPNDNDFKKENRKKFIANISLNDYDCIILSHEQYCMLPHTEEAERAVIDEQMWQLDNMIEYLYGTNDTSQMTKKQIKALEKRRENLKARLEKRLDRNVDREFCFENLGIDYLFVDESHQFKSLPYVTSYQKVAGLGDAQGSSRAVALLTGIRHLQRMHQGDKGTVFLSGTTITNSLVEIYNLLNYLRPRKLEELGMPTFDAWASVFAVHSAELEAGVTGNFAMKDRFRSFDNVPELSQLYAEIADVRNDTNLKLPKPAVDGRTVIVPASDSMQEINSEIVNMLENKDGSYFGIHPKDPNRAPWGLHASTLSAKAAVSPRLIFPDMEDDGGKVTAVCGNVKKFYDEQADRRGVQLIFCEMGVPDKSKKYDAYTDMVNRFVNDYGIPRSEIAYIQEANTEEKRKDLFQRVRDGKVRILIGGTKNMGTGVNVQDRITDMHMLTVPWTPSALEQCIGRGARQGNLVARDFMDNKVRVHYYATEGSLDLYKYQLLDAKGKMFTQFKMGTVNGGRSFDEGSADEEGNIDPAEMVAILSGNPVIFERAKQEKAVKKLRALRNGFERDYQRKKAKQTELQARQERLDRLVRLNDRDRADLEREGFKPDDKGVYPANVTIMEGYSRYGGRTFDKPKEAGEYLLKMLEDGKDVTLQGFGQRARVVTVNEEGNGGLFSSYRVLQIGDGERDIKYTVRLSDDATAAGTAFRNLLKRIIDNGAVYKRDLEETKNQLAGMNIGDGVFPKQAELDKAIAKFKELNAEYNKLGKKPDSKDGNKYRLVEEGEELDWLESLGEDELVHVYRNVQILPDGSMASPMAAYNVETGEIRRLTPGRWNGPEERQIILTPEQESQLATLTREGEINGKNFFQISKEMRFYMTKKEGVKLQFNLTRDGSKDMWADYNPYDHAIKVMLNDQFKAAWKRPNLVVVEAVMPKSEIEGAYKAPYAALPTGEHKWNNGRSLYLSRWSKIVRIVPFAEVAADIDRYWRENPSAYKGAKVTDYDRFQPQVREELERLGYRFDDKGNRGSLSDAEREKAYKSENAIYITNEDIERMNAEMTQDWRETPANELALATQPKNEKEAEQLAMLDRVENLSEKLNTPIRIITKESELQATSEDGRPRYSRRERRAKGWWSARTGEVVVVLPNNVDVADVENTVVHEIVGHKGLRAFIGEERFDEFLGEVYDHASNPIRAKIDKATDRMVGDEADRLREQKRKAHERAGEDWNSTYYSDMAEARVEAEKRREEFRRAATEEYMSDLGGRIGDEGFEKMSQDELTLWGKIKAKVQGFLDRFFRGLKIAKSIRLNDKDLSYILFKSWKHQRESRTGEREIFMEAKDAMMRYNSGWDDAMTVSEKRARIDKLRKSEPVEISGEEIEYSHDLKQFKKNAVEYGKALQGEYLNEDQGKMIQLQRGRRNGGLKEVLQHDLSDESHIRSIAAIPDIIRKSIYIETVPNHDMEKNPDVKGYEHYVCGLKIGDEDYTAHSIVAEDKNGNRYYDHKLSHIEKGKLLDFIESKQPLEQILTPMSGTEPTIRSERKIKELISLLQIDDGGDVKRFRDAGMGLEETITKMKVEAAAASGADFAAKQAAMRAIGGNLNHLRQAMARQREYDITTVKSVSDLARVLMEQGLLDDLSKYETKRILSAINNVVGRQDVSQYVQKVMDIMVDNQLRMGANTLGRLMSIRGSRVDARGIEVQGELDPEGQRIAQVVRKSTSLPKDDIDNRLAEAMNRMSSTDQAIAEEATIEYAGLQLARQYVEDITESKAEEKALRESIKQAKEDKDSGQMTEDAYRQLVEATEDAIRQNKIERAESFYSLVEQIGGVLSESIERAKEWREAEKQRVEEIHHNANSDMTGRPTDEHHKDSRLQKIANNSGVRFLLAPLATFDQMLRMFGGKSVRGEGYLWNRYMRGWVEATEKEYTGYRDALMVLDAKVSEIFGRKMTWGDLFGMDRKLPKASVRFWDGGEMKEHELTQGNLLYIYMADKMTDGRMKLRRMGITEDDVNNIKDFLDPRFIALADWMQEEFLVDKRNDYNEVHKRMFGASMAAIENYFPLKILANARLENVDVADDTTDTVLPSTSTGSIIKRRRNNLALDVTGANAFSVILDHLQQMERWAAFAEFNRDLNTLLSYKRFRNQVMNMTSAYGAGKTLWNNFRNVCSMAAGAYRPPIAALDKAAVNIAKGVTAAKVSFRVFTALKQFLSMPAYASDSNPIHLAANIANPIGAWKWSMENLPLFEKRWRSRMAGDPRLLKSDMDWKMWRSRVVEIASRVGMSPNAFVDALTVAIGTHAMYQTKKAKYLRWGMEEDAAEKRAKQDATILFNQTQQSSEGAFLSTMQVDRSWLSVLFTVFRNSSMSYTRQLYDAMRNLGHRMTHGYKDMSEEYMAKQMKRDGIDPDTADRESKREYRRGIVRDLVRVGIFGAALQLAWNLGAYLPYILLGDDEEEKDKMWDDVWTHTMFGSVEGLTGGDVMSAAGNMWASGEGNPAYLTKDMPLAADVLDILKNWDKDKVSAMNDVVNLLVQSGLGVNPQSLTDAAVAVMDYCGEDAQTSRECALLICRILNCPQSQIEKIYFDEIDATGEEASTMTPEEIAERYAEYKLRRNAPLTGWAYDEETRKKTMERHRRKARTTVKGRLGSTLATRRTRELLEGYGEVREREKELNRLKKRDRRAYREGMRELRESTDMRRYNRLKRYDHDIKRLTEEWLEARTPEEADSIVRAMAGARERMLMDVEGDEAQQLNGAGRGD